MWGKLPAMRGWPHLAFVTPILSFSGLASRNGIFFFHERTDVDILVVSAYFRRPPVLLFSPVDATDMPFRWVAQDPVPDILDTRHIAKIRNSVV